MRFSTLLFYLLFIPLVFGAEVSSKVNQNSTSTTKEPINHGLNKTEIVVSEGGPVAQKLPSSTLPKENNTTFLGDTDLGKDKSDPPTNSKVVPRKGVVFSEIATDLDHAKVSNVSDHHKQFEYIPVVELNQNDTKKTTVADNNYFKYNMKPINDSSANDTTTADSHKKPLILSYEGLSTKDQGIQHNELNIPAIKSSTNPITQDQMPSPSKENEPTIKISPINSGRHPGMVMPIIITILVVPMFAFLGYMALRRGQEAWKNRHYKRMDFLLDGMYND